MCTYVESAHCTEYRAVQRSTDCTDSQCGLEGAGEAVRRRALCGDIIRLSHLCWVAIV